MEYQTQLLIVMISYMALLILWGLYQGRNVKSEGDYAIAGRNLPGWVAALSERATGESSWALLGLPGAAYATGLTEIWTAIGCVLGIITAWALISWRLRDEAEKYNANTFTDYIAKKHGNLGKWIRIVGSFTIVFFFFFYVGAQFLGGGKTLHTMFGIDARNGMIITAAIIVPYTIYGGFRSVVYTDVIQAIIMIITLVVGPIVGIIYISNHPELFATNISDALHFAGESYTLTGGASGFAAGIVIATGFSWFFGYLGGQPQLSTRFMAIKDAKQAKKARNVGIIWTIVAYMGALTLGWVGLAIFGPTGLEDREYVMPSVILFLFPTTIAAILITGAIAAMVSTADSLLILSSTELTENLAKFKMKSKLMVSRITTAVLAIIALTLAYFSYAPLHFSESSFQNMIQNNVPQEIILELKNTAPEYGSMDEMKEGLQEILQPEYFDKYNQIIISSAEEGGALIFTIVGYVWAGIGGTFSIVILLSLFWKRFNGTAALATIAVGLPFTIFWIAMGYDKTILTSRIMTFLVAGFVAVVVTIVTTINREQQID